MIVSQTVETIWEEVLNTLKPGIKAETFDLWVKPLKPKNFENQLLTVIVPNRFFSDWVNEHYRNQIELALKNITGGDVALGFEMTQEIEPILKREEAQIDPIQTLEPEKHFTEAVFNPKYTFDTFVVGGSNRFAQATAQAVAKDPGKAYNPVFLYGGVGLGKTHLLHAIGHHIHRVNPKARVLYITAEKFINEFIDGLRFDRMKDFRSKYRSLDCLLIDDIQFFVGKATSQEEFFYTFNTLFDSHKQIVISSDRTPKETQVGDRLISRFEWGVIADIQPPDLETRIAILRKKAAAEQIFVPEDVILYIASQIRSNIRELEGCLIRIVAFSSLTGTPLTVDSARETLKDIVSVAEVSHPITIDGIQGVVAKHFNLDLKDMRSKRRTDAIAFPRQIAMYLARTLTECSTTEIGEAFGGKDHTTVMHACNKIKSKMASDPYFVALVNKITQQVKTNASLDLYKDANRT
ncbi:MAG TPA: chromosomal replication initiator protein DnaA [Elusimicrobiota bacterium]|nr:chromosomal replication initiator protein DnaA [Elusimicrobiota bacterium]